MAGRNFSRRRLVIGRRAPDRRRDVRIDQRQAIVGPLRRREARQSCRVHRAHEKVAGPIARKYASGSIRAVRRRREAQDQNARIRIPEPGNGPAPIRVVAMRRFLVACDAVAVRPQPRAAVAYVLTIATEVARLRLRACGAIGMVKQFSGSEQRRLSGKPLVSRPNTR